MPLVESVSPSERKPRRGAVDCNTNETCRRISTKRPWKVGSDGYALPTDLEIEEGKAFKAFKLAGSDEKSETGEAWKLLHIRLFQEEGTPSVCRCPWCYTLRFGRPITIPCAVCGTIREVGE